MPKEKEKKQLRDKGHVNCCYLSKEDTIDEVRLKLVKAFPVLKNEMVAFMQATRSDLFICEKDVINTGADVLSLTASSGLYITTLAAQLLLNCPHQWFKLLYVLVRVRHQG